MYVTIEEADAYFQARLRSSAWDDADSDSDITKTKALTEATAIIDRLSFAGEKTNDAQTNEFPRDGEEEIPQAIKDACCEIAYTLLDGVDIEVEAARQRVTREKFADVEATFDGYSEHILAGVPSFTAWSILKQFLKDNRALKLDRIS